MATLTDSYGTQKYEPWKLLWGLLFQFSVKKIYSIKVSYSENSQNWEVSIVLV